jgi:hypothetical protein
VSSAERRNFALLAVFALFFALSGCKAGAKKQQQQATAQPPPEVPKPQETWTDTPMAVPVQPVSPVKQGTLPLVYMVETATMVRVADLDSGQDLLRMPVAARTVVAVDPHVGVRVGSATMKLGPLPAEHRYAIFLESSESNFYRQGRIRPGQPGQQQQVQPQQPLPAGPATNQTGRSP